MLTFFRNDVLPSIEDWPHADSQTRESLFNDIGAMIEWRFP